MNRTLDGDYRVHELKLSQGSATRIPKTKKSLLPNQPFGSDAPFNNIDLEWDWLEVIDWSR